MPAENPMPFLRLFVAIPLPPEVRQEIGRLQARLRRETPPGTVRWSPMDQFHITLKFLGDVPAEQLVALRQALAPICAACRPLDLSAHGIGFFPHASQPRVIWAGAGDHHHRLPELQRRIEEVTNRFAPAERPDKFTSHITLGRFKPGGHGGIPQVLESAAALHDRHFGDWHASEVQLVQSQLTSVRSEHSVLTAFPFQMPLETNPLED